jgi:hypothetical protein
LADIATLGLAVDSRQVTGATKELDKLTVAGKKAEDAAKGLGRAAGPGLSAVESAAKRAGVSVEEFRARMAKASESVNKNFPLMSKGAKEAAASAYALTDALGGGKGGGDGVVPATERAEKTTRNFAETLTRRFVVAYAVSQIRTLGRALVSLTADVARVGDLGRLTGLGSSGVQGVTSAAGFKGIASDAFSGALVAFNQQIPLAKEGIGSLGALLRGNRVTVTDTADAFFKVADLVKNAASDTARLSILQQAGLPATMEMARFMGQGATAIREAAAGTSKLTDAQVEAARRIEDRWNELWTNFKTGGKAAMVDVADGWVAAWNRPFMDPSTIMGGWWEKAKKLATGAPDSLPGAPIGPVQFGGNLPAASGSNTPTRDVATEKAIAQERISKAQQYLGLLGQTTTALEARRAVELQIAAAGINGVGIDSARAETLKRLAVEQNLGITAMKQSADAARVEDETVGMSVGAAAEYVAVQNKLNEARRNGVVISPEHVESIRREAAALGEAAQHADTMRWSYTNLVQGPLQTFRSSIASGAKGFDTLKAAGVSALNAISTKLMDMAAQNLWQAAMGGKSGTGGLFGLLGGLFGLGGGGPTNIVGGAGSLPVPTFSASAKGNVFGAGISDYSNQIITKPTFFAKGGNVMGEAGPEAVMPLVRTPGGNLGVRATGGASQASVNVYLTQHNTFTGADPGSEARLRGALEKTKREAVSEATQAVAKVYASNSSYLKGRT